MEPSLLSSIFIVLGVIGSIFPLLALSLLEKNQIDLTPQTPSIVSSPPPPSPPPPPPPPPPPSPSTKFIHGSKNNVTGKSFNSHHNQHSAHHHHRPPKKTADRKINLGKKIGFLFVVIAGFLQVVVVGFIVFMRWETSKIQDRYNSCSS